MSRASRGMALSIAATLVVLGVASVVFARGGGGGGGGGGRGGGGGGGFGGGGFAGRGSLGQNRPTGGMPRGMYYQQGPAAYGNLGDQRARQGEWEGNRQERLEARQERREERHEDWDGYVGDHYDEYYGGDYDYYDDPGTGVEDAYTRALPCKPVVMAMQGVVYYICDSVWYTRVYLEDEVVYTIVPNPTGH